MSRWRAAAAVPLLCAACDHPRRAPAPPVEPPALAVAEVDTHWYAVAGHDVRSLRESLRAVAPRNADGEAINGDTRWNATWTWQGVGEPCRVDAVAVELRVSVWLPAWTPDPGTDPALLGPWRRYLEALALHEQGHVELVRAEVAQLDDILRAASCADADAVGAAALDAIRALNAEYDARTHHGALQGARFWTAPEWGASLDEQAGFAE